MLRTRLTVLDILAVLLVLCLALLFLWAPRQSRADGAFLVVTTSKGSERYSLLEDREICVEANGHCLIAVIRAGEAYVQESDCADGVCLASGRISHSGETVICAPAGVRLLIEGGDGDVDFVAG